MVFQNSLHNFNPNPEPVIFCEFLPLIKASNSLLRSSSGITDPLFSIITRRSFSDSAIETDTAVFYYIVPHF